MVAWKEVEGHRARARRSSRSCAAIEPRLARPRATSSSEAGSGGGRAGGRAGRRESRREASRQAPKGRAERADAAPPSRSRSRAGGSRRRKRDQRRRRSRCREPQPPPPVAPREGRETRMPAMAEPIPADARRRDRGGAQPPRRPARQGRRRLGKVIAAAPAAERAAPRAGARAAQAEKWAPLAEALKDEEPKVSATAGRAGRGAARARRRLRQLRNELTAVNVAQPDRSRSTRPTSQALDQLVALYESKKRWPDLVAMLGQEGAAGRRPAPSGSRSTCGRQPLPRAVLEPGRGDQGVREGARARSRQPAGDRAPARGLREAARLGEADQAQGARDRAHAPIRRARARKVIEVAQHGRDQGQEARDLHVLVGEGSRSTSRTHDEALTELEKLYERNKEWDKLAEICATQGRRRPPTTKTQRRGAAAARPALHREGRRTRPRRSTPGSGCSRIDENNRRAQDALKKLYVTDGRWDDARGRSTARRARSTSTSACSSARSSAGSEEHRLALAMKIALLYRDELAEARPRDARVREGAHARREQPRRRRGADPALRAGRDPRKLVARARDPARRRPATRRLRQERIKRLAEYNEEKLRDKGAAFGWWLQGARRGPRGRVDPRAGRAAGAGDRRLDRAGRRLRGALPKFERPAPRRCRSCWWWRGCIERELGEIDARSRPTAPILELDERNEQALDALERLYLGKGDYARAARHLRAEARADRSTATSGSRSSPRSASSTRTRSRTTSRPIAAYLAILEQDGDEPARAARARPHLRAQPARGRELADILGAPAHASSDPSDDKARARRAQVPARPDPRAAPRRRRRRDRGLPRHPRHRCRATSGARAALERTARRRQAQAGRRRHPRADLRAARRVGAARSACTRSSSRPSKDTLRRVGLLHAHRRAARASAGRRREGVRRLRARVPRGSVDRAAPRRELEELCNLLDDGWPQLVKLFEGALGARRPRAGARPRAVDQGRARLRGAARQERQGGRVLPPRARDRARRPRRTRRARGDLHARREYTELLEVYRRKRRHRERPRRAAAILFRIASIHEEMLRQPDEAIATYNEILGQTADEPAGAARARPAVRRSGEHVAGPRRQPQSASSRSSSSDARAGRAAGPPGAAARDAARRDRGGVETYRQVLELEDQTPRGGQPPSSA